MTRLNRYEVKVPCKEPISEEYPGMRVIAYGKRVGKVASIIGCEVSTEICPIDNQERDWKSF